jgi:transcriptional regulator with GAF, ATPase, and Fis domain
VHLQEVTMNKDPNPYEEGDSFLKRFLPGDSRHLKNLRATIYRVNIAHKNSRMVPSILLLGDRGTGKGYTAHTIAAHTWWLRTSKGSDVMPRQDDIYEIAANSKMRKQTLTAIPEPLAEATLFGSIKGAYTGSLQTRKGLFDCDEMVDVFIDEIGDATPNIQAKLLEVLETRTFRPLGLGFDVPDRRTEARAIFATNKNLADMVAKGEFREDLLDRLTWMPISLPRLCEQAEEIGTIITRISEQITAKYDLPPMAVNETDIEWSASYNWPGNHRELQQVIWTWRLHEGAISFREIVEGRKLPSLGNKQGFRERITSAVDDWLSALQQGTTPSFASHGDFGEELKNLGYQALYEFNRRKKLNTEDLQRMFTRQDPTNVRKQISATRGGE